MSSCRSVLALLALLWGLSLTACGSGGPDDNPTVPDDDDSGDVDDDDSSDSDDDDSASAAEDADEDGFSVDEDCDDEDGAIHPGAPETCDGVDNNCDGVIDQSDAEDAPTWYLDDDGDGYGLEGSTVEACSQPHGYSAYAGDCNDEDPAFHPGASESDCSDPADYNCDQSSGYVDADGDGVAACEDCDDGDINLSVATDETCDGADNNCDGLIDNNASDASTWYGDADDDGYGGTTFQLQACTMPSGYVDNSDDCDDLNPLSYPGAVEVCDGSDNDCDTETDEGVLLPWYQDLDQDGFGNELVVQQACSPAVGYVGNDLDCNDAAVNINPSSYELCDTLDNDCDGNADGADALDASTWYLDDDGDGFGDPSAMIVACVAPTTDHVAVAGDCNDSDGAVAPGLPELCDTLDNDCDLLVDESEDLQATSATTWYGDLDGDTYGGTWASVLSCTQPAGYSSNANDCDDLEALTYPGAVEQCDGADNDCDNDVDEEADLVAGSGSSWFLDADGDGYGDAGTAQVTCTPPSDYVSNSLDCDDDSGVNFPGNPELCDGLDNDCQNGADFDAEGELDADGDSSFTCEDCDDTDGNNTPGAAEVCDGQDNDCSGTADDAPGLIDELGESAGCPAGSCVDLNTRRPGLANGSYWVAPAGADAVEVDCDLSGGGWIELSLNDSQNIYMAEASSSNPWSKCGDDSAQHYSWISEGSVTADDAPDGGNFDHVLSYLQPSTGNVYTAAELVTLRSLVTELSNDTRMVAVTADDDGHSYQDNPTGGGHEVFIRSEVGAFLVITPGTNGECGSSSGWGQGQAAHYLWSTDAGVNAVTGDTGGFTASALGPLDVEHVIPYEVRLSVHTGGGVSFGWEFEVFKVR